jgi:hypothetical protein
MPSHTVYWNWKARTFARGFKGLVVTAGDAGGQVGLPREWDGSGAAIGDCAV